MTDLFRFVALRAAGRPLPGPSIDLSTRGDFQAALSQAVHAGDGHGLQIAHRIAQQYAEGGDGGGFTGANGITAHADAFALSPPAAAGAKNRVAVGRAVQAAFPQSAQDVAGSADVKDPP